MVYPIQMREEFNSGDYVHLNARGSNAMADTMPDTEFEASKGRL